MVQCYKGYVYITRYALKVSEMEWNEIAYMNFICNVLLRTYLFLQILTSCL